MIEELELVAEIEGWTLGTSTLTRLMGELFGAVEIDDRELIIRFVHLARDQAAGDASGHEPLIQNAIGLLRHHDERLVPQVGQMHPGLFG